MARGGVKHTLSFSTIALTPRTEADSKVSMDCSRCTGSQYFTTHLKSVLSTDVEAVQGLAVGVEGLVVELDELLCSRRKTLEASIGSDFCWYLPVNTYWQRPRSLFTQCAVSSQCAQSGSLVKLTVGGHLDGVGRGIDALYVEGGNVREVWQMM